MKRILHTLLLALSITTIGVAQQSYYDDVDLTLTGEALYDALQAKVENHSNNYTYNDFRDGIPQTDPNPNNSSEVLLVYGFSDTDGDCTTDRTRADTEFGGGSCEFNREHTFARSLADPGMGSTSGGATGIVADPHNLRPTDVSRNSARGNRRFANSTGNSGEVGSHWYPGDEWKGDVARIIMFMYVRYGDRCNPNLVGVGSNQGNTEMLQIFLDWNAEDPVSDFEKNRNPYLETVYGSRNPFIDNPYLATVIWGGTPAEDIWGTLGVQKNETASFSVYPNPATDFVNITATQPFSNIVVYDVSGTVVYTKTGTDNNARLPIQNLARGIYLVKIDDHVEKLIVN